MTRFAASFIAVFGELAFGGMFAIAIPPFFKVERGFYKSSASVYLAAGAATAAGFALLAIRGGAIEGPGKSALWTVAALWFVFCALFAVYLYTLWTDNGPLRARSYALGLGMGLAAAVASAQILEPRGFGAAAGIAYALTAIASSLVLGLVTGAMMFGHWYLIDLEMPVDYLRTFIRVTGGAIAADLGAFVIAIALLALGDGGAGVAAVKSLFGPHLALFAAWLALGPIATIVLVWMCWQTLKIPQTMAATGLLYLAMMAALVGEMLGRFILFRTGIPF